MMKKESELGKTLPIKPTVQKNFGTNQISENDASRLVGGIVEKGFSDNPQFRPIGPSNAPYPTVLPFPVARHRSHGPHWAAKVGASNGSDDEDKEEEEDFTGISMAATFANPVQRKEKKGLNFRWETLSKNVDSVPSEKKKQGRLIGSKEWKGGKEANKSNSDGSGRQTLAQDDALLNRASPYFDAKMKDVTMEDKVSIIPEEVKEKKRDILAMAIDDEQSNFKRSTADNFIQTKETPRSGIAEAQEGITGKMEPQLQNRSIKDMEVDTEMQCRPTTHFDSSFGYDKLVDERVVTSLESQIDLENRARLEKMSADEIAEAQSEIITKMSPQLINALRKRGQDKLKNNKISGLDRATNGSSGTEQNKKNLINAPAISGSSSSSHEVMKAFSSSEDSQIDKDNKVIPNLSSKSGSLWDAWSKRVERVRDLRFNLDGDVVKPDFSQVSDIGKMSAHSGYSADNVSERDFLRTEGDPGAAGYTIKEAVALTRSVVPGQRALALHLIASILDKANCSIYQHKVGCNMKFAEADGSIDWEALWAFALGPEPELALSLRISLDDNHNSVVLTCAKAIQSVLSCDINESFFNISEKIPTYSQDLFTAPVFRSKPDIDDGFLRGGFWKYNTKPSNILHFGEDPIDDKSEGEHTIQDDVTVAGQDIAAGLVRMGILPRICYLLESGPSAPLEECLISILIAIARHSPTCAAAIMNCDRLVQTVANRFAVNEQIENYPCKIKSVKLLKVLARVEKKNCTMLIKNGTFHKVTWHLYRYPFSLDKWVKSGREVCKLSSALLVEQLRFWKVCVRFGYGISQFPDLFPSLSIWLNVPTFPKLIENNVTSEFAAITKEAYLLLDALASRLPNFYLQMHQGTEVTAEDTEVWSWSQVGPIIDLALEWTKLKSLPYILDWEEGGGYRILHDSEVNCLLWIISSVMHMFSSLLKAAIPEDATCLYNGHVPWLPEFVPKIGLEIIRNGFMSFSGVNGTMSDNNTAGNGSFLGYLCHLRLKSGQETSISSTCCLQGLVRVVASVDKLIHLAKHEFHNAPAEYKKFSRDDKILADGILQSSVFELGALLSTFMKSVTNDWQCMRSIEMFGRGGPSPGVGVGWGAPGGGYWSTTTLLAQQDARLVMYLLENIQNASAKDPLTDEEMCFTMQRINSALKACMVTGPRDRAVIDKLLDILLQVPALKYIDFGIRRFLSHREGFKPFGWKYEEEEYLLFANVLATHFRNRWLSVKKKLKATGNHKTPKKGSLPLETIHEDTDAPVMVGQGPTSLIVEWAHQRLHLPTHWFLSAISTIQSGKNTDIPLDFLEVTRGGLFFLLGIEAMSTFVPAEFHSPVDSTPIVWKLHALSVTLLGGMGVLEEEKSRDVYETLQDVYGQVLDKMDVESLHFESEIHESYSTFVETLVEQFAAVSYGDVVFGRQVAIYLHRRVEVPVRLAAWNALSNARVLELLPPLEKCIAKGDGYLEPVEDDEKILEAYVKSWVSGALDRAATRRSAAFTLVLHHLSSFLFGNDGDNTCSLRYKLAKSLLRDCPRKEQRQV
ncbi:RNA polymerase II-associated protein 1 [Abeliophyllum distichum]|uniref:RNA polymerase II-associated protein 1 n=1 Tax=Abeliophyllum distichum TaxID=126358 RepID=A0ABD1TVD3_9LAMI